MRKFVSVLAVVSLLAVGAPAGAAPYDVPMSRAAGPNRIATAAVASSQHWPSASTVLLATAFNFPDALAAAALSAKLDAPILLTLPDSLPDVVKAELQRLGATAVVILGGGNAVSAGVEAELQSAGYHTRRIQGTDRYETARAAAVEVGVTTAKYAALASGVNWPDAVSTGTLAATPVRPPTLLTLPDSLPPATEQALAEIGADTVVIVGGGSAVSAGVEQRLQALAYDTIRLQGADRFATSAQVARFAWSLFDAEPGQIVFATGLDFPDALAAGGVAAKLDVPLLLVHPNDMAAANASAVFVQENAAALATATIIGGGAAVNGTSESQLRAALEGAPVPTARFGGGTKRVPEDVVPGTYRNSDSSGTCYWERLSGFSGELSDINANGLGNDRFIVTILPSDRGFNSERCGEWSPDLSPITPSPISQFGDGMYLVGSEVAAGTWRNSDSSASCYWARLSGFTGELDDINANGFSEEIQTVTIAESDAGFEAHRCGTWTKIG